MNKVQKAVLISAVLGFVSTVSSNSYADATNFSYTTLSAGLGKITYKTPICVVGECYKELGSASLSGSYQFANDLLVVSIASAAASNSGPTTKLTSNVGVFGLNIVKAVSSQVDFWAGLASLSGKSEICQGSTCFKYEDNGMAYGAGINVWLDDAKKFAGQFNVSSSKYSKNTNSYTNTLFGLSYYVTQNHEISAAYSSNDLASSTAINYAYHF